MKLNVTKNFVFEGKIGGNQTIADQYLEVNKTGDLARGGLLFVLEDPKNDAQHVKTILNRIRLEKGDEFMRGILVALVNGNDVESGADILRDDIIQRAKITKAKGPIVVMIDGEKYTLEAWDTESFLENLKEVMKYWAVIKGKYSKIEQSVINGPIRMIDTRTVDKSPLNLLK